MIDRRTLLLGPLAALTCPAPAVASPKACQVRVRWSDAPPLTFMKGTEVVGIQADLVREALRRLDCAPLWVERPWARALLELKSGQLDLVPAAFERPDRALYAHFSVPYASSRSMVFVQRSRLRDMPGTTLAALAQSEWRFGVQMDVSNGPQFDALLAQRAFRTAPTVVTRSDSLLRMLSLGRVDAVVYDEWLAAYEIQRQGLAETVAMTDIMAHKEAVPDAFSKATTQASFVARYSHAMQAIERDGTLKTILARYGVEGQSPSPGSRPAKPS